MPVLIPIRLAIHDGLPIAFVDVGTDDERELEIHRYDESGATIDSVAVPEVGSDPKLIVDLAQTDDALYFVVDVASEPEANAFVCRFDPR